jgi:hypothetical protein
MVVFYIITSAHLHQSSFSIVVSVAVWLNALGEQRQQTRLDQWGDTAFSRDGRISRCMLATVAGCTRDQEVLSQVNDPFNTSVAFLNAAIAPLENAEQVLFAPLCPLLLLPFPPAPVLHSNRKLGQASTRAYYQFSLFLYLVCLLPMNM